MLETILMVFALVFFCCAAANVPYPRVSFGWLGLAFWVLAILFGGAAAGGHLGRYRKAGGGQGNRPWPPAPGV